MLLSRVIYERVAAFFILPILPLLIASVLYDPGAETQPEYTAGSIARYLPKLEEFVSGVLLMLATAVVTMAAAGGLFLRFRQLELPSAIPSTFGMLAAGLLTLGAAGAGFRIDQLAMEWPALNGAAADQLERSAVSMGQLRFMLAGLGVVLLLISLISCGFIIHRLTTLPRWLLSLPVTSGVIMVASPLGFVSIGLFAFLAVSGLVLFAWLIIESGWLLIRGWAASRLDYGSAAPS